MLTSETHLRVIVNEIYRSATQPEDWPGTLTMIADAFESTTAGFAYGRRHGGGGISLFVRSDPAWERAYGEYYAYRNPYQSAEHLIREGLVATGEALLPNDELMKTEYYADFLAKQDLLQTLAAFPIVRGDVASTVIFYRPRRRPTFDQVDVDLLRLLLPHLVLALRVHERLTAQAQPSAAASALLAEVPFGIMVLDKTGRVRLLNSAAAGIVSLNDGLTIRRGLLEVASAGAGTRLRACVRSASHRPRATLTPRGGAVTVHRPSMGRPFRLLVAPLDMLERAAFEGALVFVSDPGRRLQLDADRVRAALGVTAREAAIVVGLVAGHDLNTVAREAAISVETARTHLKHIFKKTRTGSQPELVAQVLAIPGLEGTGQPRVTSA